jgi:hypothetical protein
MVDGITPWCTQCLNRVGPCKTFHMVGGELAEVIKEGKADGDFMLLKNER